MNIAIIGAGNVGGALGRSWAKAGHAIVYGVRDPQAEKTRALVAETARGATAASVEAAVRALVWSKRSIPMDGKTSRMRLIRMRRGCGR